MFRLLTSCWARLKKTKEKRRKASIIVISLDNSSEISVTDAFQRLLPRKLNSYLKSGRTNVLLDNYEVSIYDLNRDTKGQEFRPNYYAQAQGVVFVLDISDLGRLQEAKTILTRVLSEKRLSGKPILLLANKQHKSSTILPCDMEHLFLEKLLTESQASYRVEPCSLTKNMSKKDQQSIVEGLRWLLNAIENKSAELSTSSQPVIASTSTARNIRTSGEGCSSESFTAGFGVSNENLHLAGQQSVEAKPLKSILQKEGVRLRPKKNVSVTFVLDGVIERGGRSKGRGVSNSVHFCRSQTSNPSPRAAAVAHPPKAYPEENHQNISSRDFFSGNILDDIEKRPRPQGLSAVNNMSPLLFKVSGSSTCPGGLTLLYPNGEYFASLYENEDLNEEAELLHPHTQTYLMNKMWSYNPRTERKQQELPVAGTEIVSAGTCESSEGLDFRLCAHEVPG
ncbi:PREDICTED: ADP-ribosylation factor-like protein 13A [Condylura cristata]|uniref:ADP-ribosylation factor-like protein 13A n=1 Tax=Condylura cristata TaxID=143302 RepID=UPI00033446EE|nr:PREDICTED: ADP-ribosylation factor-like protein 13A [Condylura cristata]